MVGDVDCQQRACGGMTRVRWTGDVGSSHRIQNLGFADWV